MGEVLEFHKVDMPENETVEWNNLLDKWWVLLRFQLMFTKNLDSGAYKRAGDSEIDVLKNRRHCIQQRAELVRRFIERYGLEYTEEVINLNAPEWYTGARVKIA